MEIKLGAESLEILIAFQKFEKSELFTIAYDAVEALKKTLVTSWSVAENNLHALTKAEQLLNHRLGTYTDTFTKTYATQWEQMLKDETARSTSGESYWKYVGPDDEKTRPQCQDGLTILYFTDDEKNDFNGEGIRWNCRHTFDLVSEKEYDAGVA